MPTWTSRRWHTDPANPVIGSRAFGSDPDLVARHTAAFVEGLQAHGVAACTKHFPGHGDTRLDSHTDAPTVDRPAAALMETEIAPFRAAIDAGAAAVMSAHVRYPVWDAAPATVSRRILTTLLREELGFTGVVVTDALRMAAISGGMGAPAGAALAAGADLLCVDLPYAEQRQVRTAVCNAVRAGVLSEVRVHEAAERVRALSRCRRSAGVPVDPAIGLVAARRALLVDPVTLPLAAPPYVIDAGVRVCPGAGVTSLGLVEVLSRAEPRFRGVTLTDPPDDLAAAIPAAAGMALVLSVRDAHRVGWQADLVAAALARRPDCIVVGTGTSHDRALAAGRYVGAHGCGRVNLQAVAELLLARP